MDNINNNIAENINNRIEDSKKVLKKTSLKIPIILTVILCIISIPFIRYVFFEEHEGLEGLSALGDFIFLLLEFAFLCIIWIVYLIKLTINKKKNNDKNWWIPIIIIALIIIIPRLFLSINHRNTMLNENKEIFTNVEPEIVSYEKLSGIPIYNDYKVLGEEIDEYDVYSNFDKYNNTKVLVKGIPSYRGSSGTYGNTETVNISNENPSDILLYRFSFIDKSSEFHNDGKVFFATKDTSLEDYYVYIYGTIASVQNISSSGNDYKVINIKPEKIYYTLKWDTMFIKEDEIVYSECAKVGNTCTIEELKKGQVVNVSVNDKETFDFYVLHDDGETLTLYGYEAFEQIAYLNEQDTKTLLKQNNEQRNKYDDSIDYYMHNYWGPYTLMKRLNELTSEWINILPISSYDYYPNKEGIFKSINIKDGVTTITSSEGNKIVIPGTSVARVISEKDFLDEYDLEDFYGKPCLRTLGIREGLKCNIWVLEASLGGEHFGVSISSGFNDNQYTAVTVTSNIHEKNYLVPVIEVSKDKINDK